MGKNHAVFLLIGMGMFLALVSTCAAKKTTDNVTTESKREKSASSLSLSSVFRLKRGYGGGGGGHGGGGGGHGGGYGGGPGAGGGARGPVYFCVWVGSKIGSGGYGGGYGR